MNPQDEAIREIRNRIKNLKQTIELSKAALKMAEAQHLVMQRERYEKGE